jgi:hypothetical protein
VVRVLKRRILAGAQIATIPPIDRIVVDRILHKSVNVEQIQDIISTHSHIKNNVGFDLINIKYTSAPW